MSKGSGATFWGTLDGIRAVEDSIRVTRKYSKSLFRRGAQHPIQGAEIPSRVVLEYYEVYPEIAFSWDMPAGQALDWLFYATPCIVVKFVYDYRANTGQVVIPDGPEAVKQLADSIPNFADTLATAIACRNDCVDSRTVKEAPKIETARPIRGPV